MEIKGTKLLIMMVITFIIVFLMNYLGDNAPDKVERALMTGFAGAVGLGVGLWIMNKFKGGKNDQQNFD